MLLIPLSGVGRQLFVRKVAAHLVDHLMLLRKLRVGGVLALIGR